MAQDEAQAKFDRVLVTLTGLPGVRMTRPSTVVATPPLIGASQTYIVQTARDKDHGNVIFVQLVDAEGRARLVLPDKVAQAIYRQAKALADRSTPATRARKAAQRARAKAKREREARKARRLAAVS